MKAVPRRTLSQHELERCHAVARGHARQVREEDILLRSLDKRSSRPGEDDFWPVRRHWLMVDSEEGASPAQLWEVREGLGPEVADEDPHPTRSPSTAAEKRKAAR
jgi:hypothetical protein